VLHPSAEKLNPLGKVYRKMNDLVNTPTHTWVYTRAERIERNGNRRSITRQASVVSPIQRGAVYLNTKKLENGLRIILTETTSIRQS
jgi:hypothetical protein